ncbi:DNA helicase PcrA [Anaerotalea alkaliphila]|uniref:ATP-dependent DNA helicase n=1 Tax=Anaerotalea alkaliphila TaxID=2662126 RepID=A0A7X5HU36_9FIRM|nr:DNA helicase PcrA [Anaerotalea alkaliphila]NDL66669.1 DNA helicase PcrA [Anaerotalea alkaliphila]
MDKYKGLNEPQRTAVFHVDGPLLLLAGAGSGKTRVLTHRIAYMIEEKGVAPWQIMAITFTNKAAKEMRERVDKLVGAAAADVWVSTFHSSCVRILRRHADRVGYDRSFTIYDADDSKKLVRECMKQLNVDPKYFKESAVLSAISGAKNQYIGPAQYRKDALGDMRKETIGKIYDLYQQRLKSCNVMDFDDLLVKTVELFVMNEDVLAYYQDKFRYIMVDEYQDTNGVQFRLVHLLAKKHRNLCVVGDDDQSIYRFRGADIRNILDFEAVFGNAQVVRLEQNYRSTRKILDAANGVIRNNRQRKPKKLWTDNQDGMDIVYKTLYTEVEEAAFIAEQVAEGVKAGRTYKDHAVLYRTNAQSRAVEDSFVKRNIPYKLVGGVSFYQRKEIKDILAYMVLVDNSADDLSLRRIINVPKRGIGDSTVERIGEYAYERGIGMYEALGRAREIPGIARAASKVEQFHAFMEKCRGIAAQGGLVGLVETILKETGYEEALRLENTPESQDRLGNIGELVSKMAEYETMSEDPSLVGFLEEVALVAAIDTLEGDDNKVVLMTLHSAKGLEFPVVFLGGMEDGLFPGYMSINSGNPEDIEEERRLCYVGITRAMEQLYLLNVKRRLVHGTSQFNMPSRFIREIPQELLAVHETELTPSIEAAPVVGMSPRTTGKYAGSLYGSGRYGAKPSQGDSSKRSIPGPSDRTLEYGEGDLVKHGKFGVGQVQRIEAGGADYQVTVNFPSHGVKKLLSSFAGLKKV